jgi:UDP-glucose 4-epimerase
MRYLVTGGCGFIGSHLVDALLARGDEVAVLDDLSSGKLENLSERASLLRGSVLDRELVRYGVRGVQACIHLAAIASVTRSDKDWIGSHNVNQTGFVVLLDALRQAGLRVPVVYASSAAVYGHQRQMPIPETAPLRPISAYGADKLCCEIQARTAAQTCGIPSLGLRFFNVYGPRQDPTSPYSGVISIFAKAVLEKKPLTVFGDGRQTRDFVFVRDVVAALLAAVDKTAPRADVLNVCAGTATTISQLASTIMSVGGANVPIAYRAARAGDIRHSVGSPLCAIPRLGIGKATVLYEGLRQTLEWLRETREDQGSRPGGATNSSTGGVLTGGVKTEAAREGGV